MNSYIFFNNIWRIPEWYYPIAGFFAMKLPQSFSDHMKLLLGDAYPDWLSAMEEPPCQGLRINTAKLDRKTWEEIRPWAGEPVPWSRSGYYYDAGERPARDPYYYAGLYYLQEPSAMAPASALLVEPGDRVLDLCAAPGGKSTELGARLLSGHASLAERMELCGLLVSNDISSSRARALVKNLELSGIPNICVTCEAPEKLADAFGPFFDKILVDAPCSGEGMFRRDPGLIRSWQKRGPDEYAPVQREILRQAVRMLRPGGYLLYSTCTFAPVENEETIDWLLGARPDMELVELPLWENACRGVDGKPVIRLFPHRVRGEGHFLALLRRHPQAAGEAGRQERDGSRTGRSLPDGEAGRQERDGSRTGRSLSDGRRTGRRMEASQVEDLEKESDFPEWECLLKHPLDRRRMMVKGGQVYYLPADFDSPRNLRYLRTGLFLGEWKKRRFEPSQAAAMALTASEFLQTFSMTRNDERVVRYLKGETIPLKEGETLPGGWILVCVDGFPLGWAKYSGNILKNKYYAGWRWQ